MNESQSPNGLISLGGKRWRLCQSDENLVTRFVQVTGLPEFVARLLSQRGVDPKDLDGFLSPTLRKNCPDPFLMAGMKQLAEDVADRIIQDQKIGILADFDVDGATSAAILTRFLRYVGQEPPIYIPDRLDEGYGPNEKAFVSLKEQGAELVIIADCGITAHEAIQSGRNLGLDIIVLDHHEPEGDLPKANHVINPKRDDDVSGLDMLAACGVSFLTCVAINTKIREKGFYKDRVEAPLKSWLDLVALGTICDMVPLVGVNRLFVKAGFEQMAHQNNAGIRALCQVGNIHQSPTPEDAGWVIGPRINAGSRVHRSDLGAKLLSTDSEEEAQAIAWALEECNEERKIIQARMMREAQIKVEGQRLLDNPIIIVDDPEWHPGLSGLVAGRLKEKYGKPAIVVTYAITSDGNREGRGSGRSVPGLNMADLFAEACHQQLLVKGGGHMMAGGFTIEPEKLDAFQEFACEYVLSKINQDEAVDDLEIHSLASVRGVSTEFVRMLYEQVGPFGVGNREPVFILPDVMIHQIDVLKDKHIRAYVSDREGGGRIKAMFFNGVDTDLGQSLLKQFKVLSFHLVGQFHINEWQGRESVEFRIQDGVAVMDNAVQENLQGRQAV